MMKRLLVPVTMIVLTILAAVYVYRRNPFAQQSEDWHLQQGLILSENCVRFTFNSNNSVNDTYMLATIGDKRYSWDYKDHHFTFLTPPPDIYLKAGDVIDLYTDAREPYRVYDIVKNGYHMLDLKKNNAGALKETVETTVLLGLILTPVVTIFTFRKKRPPSSAG